MAKEKDPVTKVVEDHKPKNFKFKYIIKDDNLLKELEDSNYDISSLDTINDTDLTLAAMNASFKDYPSTITPCAFRFRPVPPARICSQASGSCSSTAHGQTSSRSGSCRTSSR